MPSSLQQRGHGLHWMKFVEGMKSQHIHGFAIVANAKWTCQEQQLHSQLVTTHFCVS